jgi:hypothetical protein
MKKLLYSNTVVHVCIDQVSLDEIERIIPLLAAVRLLYLFYLL